MLAFFMSFKSKYTSWHSLVSFLHIFKYFVEYIILLECGSRKNKLIMDDYWEWPVMIQLKFNVSLVIRGVLLAGTVCSRHRKAFEFKSPLSDCWEKWQDYYLEIVGRSHSCLMQTDWVPLSNFFNLLFICLLFIWCFSKVYWSAFGLWNACRVSKTNQLTKTSK